MVDHLRHTDDLEAVIRDIVDIIRALDLDVLHRRDDRDYQGKESESEFWEGRHPENR